MSTDVPSPEDEIRVQEIVALLAHLPAFSTADDVSAALSVSLRLIADETRRGRLRAAKLGRGYIYTRLDIARWFVGRENASPPTEPVVTDKNPWGRPRRALSRDQKHTE